MQIIDLQSLISSAVPVSPDRKYSLSWTSAGVLCVRGVKDDKQVVGFKENHGSIVRAGFSPDMRQIVAENEDGSFSVWFTTKAIYEVKCHAPENIVPFMCANGRVPYLNISPSRYYKYSLRDFTHGQKYCYG